MGKSVLLAQEAHERKKKSSTLPDKSNEVFFVNGLPDVDTTKWIAKDEPLDLDKLLAESRRKK